MADFKNRMLYGCKRNSTHIIKECKISDWDSSVLSSGISYCGQHILQKEISKYKSGFDVCKKCLKFKEKYDKM